MGANGLVVGDRFPSHSDDYTARITTAHEDTSSTSRGPKHVMNTQSRFFFSSKRLLSVSLSLPQLSIPIRPSPSVRHSQFVGRLLA